MKKLILFVILGSALGYIYYYFFGCKDSCPITSNYLVTVAYGAIVGLTLGFPNKKKK